MKQMRPEPPRRIQRLFELQDERDHWWRFTTTSSDPDSARLGGGIVGRGGERESCEEEEEEEELVRGVHIFGKPRSRYCTKS